jgi:hypothetical protein
MSSTPDAEEVRAPEPPEEKPPLRASDADRQAIVHRLQDAVANGSLTFDEAGERMAAAYAARFAHDLPPLTADLPPAAVPVAPHSGPPGWRQVLAVFLEQVRAEVALVMAGGMRSPRSRRTVVVALALVLLMVTVGSLALHGLFGGDPHPFRGGFGPPGGFRDH